MSEPTNDMNKAILDKLLAQEIELIELRRIRSEQGQALDGMRFNVLEDPVLRQAFAAAAHKDYEAMKAELGELEGIRSYLKWNGLQADLKDWLDWRSGKNGSEIPFPKDYLPPNP